MNAAQPFGIPHFRVYLTTFAGEPDFLLAETELVELPTGEDGEPLDGPELLAHVKAGYLDVVRRMAMDAQVAEANGTTDTAQYRDSMLTLEVFKQLYRASMQDSPVRESLMEFVARKVRVEFALDPPKR